MIRVAAFFAVLGMLLLPLAACKGRASTPPGGMCQTIPWGGFNGTPECQGISQQLIQGQHRGCAQDSDCALIAANACSAHAVNIGMAPAYAAYAPPCNHPLAGMCIPVQWRVVCQQGCCAPSSAPPPSPF